MANTANGLPQPPADLSANSLGTYIDKDIEVSQTLLGLLEKEREALKEKQMETLESLLEEKGICLNHLEQSAELRTQWISSYRAKLSRSGEPPQGEIGEQWTSLIQRLGQPEVLEKWHALQALTKQCRDENEVNGRIISRNQQTFGRLLDILRGQTGSTGLYNNIGGKAGNLTKNQLGEA